MLVPLPERVDASPRSFLRAHTDWFLLKYDPAIPHSYALALCARPFAITNRYAPGRSRLSTPRCALASSRVFLAGRGTVLRVISLSPMLRLPRERDQLAARAFAGRGLRATIQADAEQRFEPSRRRRALRFPRRFDAAALRLLRRRAGLGHISPAPPSAMTKSRCASGLSARCRALPRCARVLDRARR